MRKVKGTQFPCGVWGKAPPFSKARCAASSIINSQSAIAKMLSSTTTARGTMHGSCRPAISKTAFSRLAMSIVRCACAMEGVGLIAARKITGMPLVMPPVIPPL